MYFEPSPAPETTRIPNFGWEQTPATVKQVLESEQHQLKEWERRLAQREQQLYEREQQLGEREQQLAERERQLKEKEQQLAELQLQVELLQERKNRTSSNSSMPPSLDPPNAPKRRRKKSSGRKRGGQPGHQGHSRVLYPVEECHLVSDHYPEKCPCCGGQVHGEDTNPYRHQVIDIPPITALVTEHRLHQLQ